MDLNEAVKVPVNEILSESEKAWHILLDNGSQDWFPKSQCRIIEGILYLPKWIAEKKGIKNED